MQIFFVLVIVVGGVYQLVVFYVGIVYVSGQLLCQYGELCWIGKVGSEFDLEQVCQVVWFCVVCCLQVLEEVLGGL